MDVKNLKTHSIQLSSKAVRTNFFNLVDLTDLMLTGTNVCAEKKASILPCFICKLPRIKVLMMA